MRVTLWIVGVAVYWIVGVFAMDRLVALLNRLGDSLDDDPIIIGMAAIVWPAFVGTAALVGVCWLIGQLPRHLHR